MNDNFKKSLKEKSKLTKIFYKNGQRKTDHEKLVEKATECTNEILEAKTNYILKMSKKLEDSHTAPKAYWTILNRLTYNKKIPAIPSLFVDGIFISDICAKVNIFNNYFWWTCTPIKNTSVLTPFSYKTNTRINYFKVTESNILSMVKSLDSTKARGYDNLLIWMIKICSKSTTLPF